MRGARGLGDDGSEAAGLAARTDAARGGAVEREAAVVDLRMVGRPFGIRRPRHRPRAVLVAKSDRHEQVELILLRRLAQGEPLGAPALHVQLEVLLDAPGRVVLARALDGEQHDAGDDHPEVACAHVLGHAPESPLDGAHRARELEGVQLAVTELELLAQPLGVEGALHRDGRDLLCVVLAGHNLERDDEARDELLHDAHPMAAPHLLEE